MGEVLRRLTASIRVRATLGALVVVAVVLAAAAVALVLLQRDALRSGAADTAAARAAQISGQVTAAGPPATLVGESEDDKDYDEDDEEDPEPDDVVSQIYAGDRLVVSSQPGVMVPSHRGIVELAGADHRYAVATVDTDWQGTEYTVVVAVSLEDADESVAALVPLLAVGGPLVLLVVGGVIWLVIGRALAPVERMRREVAAVSDSSLDRRVDQPASRDEIHRLAVTMNAMLDRLESSRDRQRRFVSDASHELRSPITTLRQTGEVARTYPDAIDRAELADTVVAESLRLQRLVDQLLLLTRADEGRAGPTRGDVDLDDLLLADAARLARERPDLAVDTGAVAATRIWGDRPALEHVVRNLTDNAARHARTRVTYSASESDGRVRVAVCDDGAGVPDQDRDRIFERFVRLDEARARDDGGSGLGLAIVREIVDSHGGNVRVEDADGGGARFVIELAAHGPD